MTRAVNYAYDGTEDAEKILEQLVSPQSEPARTPANPNDHAGLK